MANAAEKLLTLIQEADPVYPSVPPSSFVVDYYVTTPRGTKSRFNRSVGLVQIRNAMSEFAVYQYLKQLHPGTEITIMHLAFR